MSLISVLLAAEAATKHRAVPRTIFRHRTIAEHPLVVTAYNLSGEAAAPIGFCYGTDPKKPKLVVSAEPRNRESRFRAINAFAADLVAFIKPYLALEYVTLRNGHTLPVATNAPQIAVPNRSTRDYLGARLGRSLRYLGLGKTHEVPEATQRAGAHLSWLAEHAHMPGQSVFIAATELLTRHFATGQSSLEDENLASLLAWISNPEGSGLDAIVAAEDAAYGPVPDPKWEAKLEPLVRAWTEHARAGREAAKAATEDEVEKLVSPELSMAYQATHQALGIMRSITAAGRVPARWQFDIRQWSSHARRSAQSIPRFAKRHDAIRAAKMLEVWSSALDRLEYEEALDDPLVLAEHDAAGRCLSGTVVEIDVNNKEIKPGNARKSRVPLLKIELQGTTMLLPGESVIWAGDDRVHATIREVSQTRATVGVMGGHKSGTRLPAAGSLAMFVSLSLFGGRPPDDPPDLPWTHKGKDVEEQAQHAQEEDGSPDLSPAELAELPAGAGTPPEDVPGALL